MEETISLEFTFESKDYDALVRTKIFGPDKVHHVTIMNGELERKLYGQHIILEREGVFEPALDVADVEIAALRSCVINALRNKLTAKTENSEEKVF